MSAPQEIWNTSAWKKLEAHREEIKQTHLRSLMQDEARCSSMVAEYDGIVLDYSRQNATTTTMDFLFDLANVAGVEEKRDAMGRGDHINLTEDRAVMHAALRAPRGKRFFVDGVDVVPEVNDVLDQMEAFSNDIRNGTRLGVTGKRLVNVVSIGIGGSYLGPEFVYEALRTDSTAAPQAQGRKLRFLANVDPVDVSRALEGFDPAETLVIVVSKTFTTAETMLNASVLRDWLVRGLSGSAEVADITRQHMCACSTAAAEVAKFGIDTANMFGFWNWVGGRYSVSSAVGVLPLALQYGMPVVREFLAGCHDMDNHFFEAPLRSNLPIIMGLLGVWNGTFFNRACRAVLPYSQSLLRFAAHIQQVEMESNGKRVSAVTNTVVPFNCGEIIFGEPGTNGQHSFYQLIHQGREVPAEFIGFCESPAPIARLDGQAVASHDELMANFFAQPDALAYGLTAEEVTAAAAAAGTTLSPSLVPHKEFPGNRPSLSILMPSLTARSCGQLLAMYEHRVAVQGFVWGINSFDQWGVELGKVLGKRVRGTLQASRTRGSADLTDYNSSTSTLLSRYLGHNN